MHDIFFFTDIHGMYDLYRAIMDYCQEQDPEAMIIFGGDACDRGPDGYKIMKELLDNPQVVYLKGNHEDMFCDAAKQIKNLFGFKNPDRNKVKTVLNSCRMFDYKYKSIQLALQNGGLSTLIDWVMDGMPMHIVDKVEHLPLTFSTDVMDFCHAAGVYRTFSRVADAEYNIKPVEEYDAISLIWGRSALGYGWAPNRIVAFGHTPIPYIIEDLEIDWPEEKAICPIRYSGNLTLNPTQTGDKIAMDTGVIFSNRSFVLNCLTMKAQGFELKNDKVEKSDLIQL